MIVRYARERGYKGKGKDQSLTLGADYFVLDVELRPNGLANSFSVQRESDGTPVVFDCSIFNIIDPRLPEGWGFYDLSENYHRLCPNEFSGDFWDRFHDGDTEAEAIFETVAKKIEAFHSS